MRDKNEELLDAWLRLSTAIINEKVVSEMPYNEALICNILYRNQQKEAEHRTTATDLCRMTKMLKSQMNRTLVSLEKKGYILRERSDQDRRRIYVRLDMNGAKLYEKQHRKILELIDTLAERVGYDRVDEIIRLFQLIADIAEGVL